MTEQLCGCSVRLLNPQDVSYVYRGVPFCRLSCMRRAEDRDDQRRARPARDVPPGTSWAFPEHRTLAEVDAGVPVRIVAIDGHYEVRDGNAR